MSLTAKQARFVDEYLVDLNAAAAARRAGYSVRTANVIGYENLTKPHIAEAIQEAMRKRASRCQVAQDDVVRELARIAFQGLASVAEWGPTGLRLLDSADLDDDAIATVKSVKETTSKDGGSLAIQQHDKIRALEALGKHLGMFKQEIEHSGSVELRQKVEHIRIVAPAPSANGKPQTNGKKNGRPSRVKVRGG